MYSRQKTVPKGWVMTKLDSVGDITGGGTPDSTNPKYWNGDILWAVPTDITKLSTNYINDTERKITKLGLKNSSAKILTPGTILITTRATIGKCAITNKTITTNQGFQNITCNNNFDRLYIFYMILYNSNKLLRLSYGTTFLEISKSAIKTVKITTPKLKTEQTKIASILSGVDATIEATQKIIEKTEKLKKGLMQQLLTRGIRHTKFKKAFLGQIVKFASGNFLPAKDHNRGNIPIYGGNGITGYHNQELIDYSTIIFGRVGAHCGSVHFTNKRSWITDNAIFIQKFSNQITVEYLYRFLSRLNLRLLAEISAQPKISQDILAHIKIYFPENKHEQTQIASILSGVDAICNQLLNARALMTQTIFLRTAGALTS